MRAGGGPTAGSGAGVGAAASTAPTKPPVVSSGASASAIAEDFAKTYYGLLAVRPSALRQFYQEDSEVSRQWCNDGDVAGAGEAPVCVKALGLQQIMQCVMHSVGGQDPDAHSVPMVVTRVASVQDTTLPDESGMLIHITGFITFLQEGTQVRSFSQTVFLQPSVDGSGKLYVRNDIVHYIGACHSLPELQPAVEQQPAAQTAAAPSGGNGLELPVEGAAKTAKPPVSAPTVAPVLPASEAVGTSVAPPTPAPSSAPVMPAAPSEAPCGSATSEAAEQTGHAEATQSWADAEAHADADADAEAAAVEDTPPGGAAPTSWAKLVAAGPGASGPGAKAQASGGSIRRPALAATAAKAGGSLAGLSLPPPNSAASNAAPATAKPGVDASASSNQSASANATIAVAVAAAPAPGSETGGGASSSSATPASPAILKLFVSGIPVVDDATSSKGREPAWTTTVPVKGGEVREALNKCLKEHAPSLTGEVVEVDRKDERKTFAFAHLIDEQAAKELVSLSKQKKVLLRGEKLFVELSTYNTTKVEGSAQWREDWGGRGKGGRGKDSAEGGWTSRDRGSGKGKDWKGSR